MSAIFLKILNMSITASWLIMAVILARLFLKKAPKWIFCILWALVAIRLLCPLSLESALSLVPSAETVNTTHYAARPYIQSGIDVIDNVANDYLGSHYFEGVTVTPGDSPSNPINVISIIWIIGMTVMFLYALISYIRLKKSVGASVPVRDNILSCDEVKSPFILGIIKPLIYVPSSMTEPTLDYVITHETAHIKRHDHWWKPLGFLLLSVYWFNPLCWIAYILLCRDIEMSCDEKVIRDMDKGNMAAYSQALLDCSFPKKRIAACPLAFGEVGVKERVRGVLNYKKPTFWIILIAVIACIGIAACLMTDPFSNKGLSEKLSISMDMAVAEHNRSSKSEGHFAAADYDIMLVKQSGNETTVYAWVLYEEYSFDGKDVKLESGSHIPTAITFDTSDNSGDSSTYDLIEYWLPRDGSYYAEDIKAKFPWYIRRKAMDVSGADRQHENCLRAAREYFGQDLPNHIAEVNTTVAYANWAEGGMMRDCLNGDKMIISSARHLPVYKLDTKEDLERFIESYKDTLTLDQGYDEVPSFDAVTASYDDSFFADHTVVIAYVAANSGSFRYAIRDISYGGSTFCLNVVQTNDPEVYTDDMAGWFVIAEVLDSDITGYTEFDAQLVNIRTDVCELYLEVLEDLWNVDSGLNSGISQIGIDLSELSHLTELEKETVMHEFASKHNLPFIAGTWEELCEQGYIDKDNLYWEDGLFFSIKTNKDGGSSPDRTAFDAQKWRSGLGAYYFGECTAQKNTDGKWSYDVGQEAIS